jgi:hypothetical protein
LSQKRQFFCWIFRRIYLKNHNIGPRLGEFLPLGQLFILKKCCWGANPGSFDFVYFLIPSLYRWATALPIVYFGQCFWKLQKQPKILPTFKQGINLSNNFDTNELCHILAIISETHLVTLLSNAIYLAEIKLPKLKLRFWSRNHYTYVGKL